MQRQPLSGLAPPVLLLAVALSLAAVIAGAAGAGDRAAASPAATAPAWTAPLPDPSKPLGGYSQVPGATVSRVYEGVKGSAYNHNVMITFALFGGNASSSRTRQRAASDESDVEPSLVVMWKNCQVDEDCNGQRILVSFSPDASDGSWSDAVVLFPNMTSPHLAATMEPSPFIHINGRVYASSSPGIHNTTHDSSAQGSQCCLWPDPLDVRNCGPPNDVAVQYTGNVMMRQVLGPGQLGDVFWGSSAGPPALFADAGASNGVKRLSDMDAQTQADIDSLSPTRETVTCEPGTGTLKCEECAGGCQVYDKISWDDKIANERTHYMLPDGTGDVLLYRSGGAAALWASMRFGSTSQQAWGDVVLTDIPNDKSNLNAGPLPDGRVYLTHNPVVPADGKTFFRDPVTVATSSDGLHFDSVGVALTCTALPAEYNSTCAPRIDGHAKNPGPSYPQGLTVVSPAPPALRQFYVAASNNKEDIFVVALPYASF